MDVVEKNKGGPYFSLLSCTLSVAVKENSERKKIKKKQEEPRFFVINVIVSKLCSNLQTIYFLASFTSLLRNVLQCLKNYLLWSINLNLITANNTAISPNSLVWKFCGKAQFPHSSTRNCAETVPFHKVSTPGN